MADEKKPEPQPRDGKRDHVIVEKVDRLKPWPAPPPAQEGGDKGGKKDK